MVGFFYFQKGGEEIANNYEGIKTQKFGIEIEMTGLTRAKAAKTLAKYFNTTVEHLGGSYDTYIIRDNQNRKWKIGLCSKYVLSINQHTNRTQEY